jgi:hypothetical protein
MAQRPAAIYRLVACEYEPRPRSAAVVERQMVVGGGVPSVYGRISRNDSAP